MSVKPINMIIRTLLKDRIIDNSNNKTGIDG